MSVLFYHNPRCSKSRKVNEILASRGIDARVIEYLSEPFDRAALETLIEALDAPARALIRTSEAAFKTTGLDPESLDTSTVIDLLLEHPELFQRPVVLTGANARIGRPPERVLELFT